MSASFGGINDYGVILNKDEFKELLMLANEKVLEIGEEDNLDDFEEWNFQELAYSIGFDQWYVSQASFYRLVKIDLESGFPEFDNTDIENDYFDDENLYIMTLKKDSLVKKYENFDEVVKEIRNRLAKNLQTNIEIIEERLGKNFIKSHIGLLNGYYYC